MYIYFVFELLIISTQEQNETDSIEFESIGNVIPLETKHELLLM